MDSIVQPLTAQPRHRYELRVPCLACNREVGAVACELCSRIEQAERRAGNYPPSPQLRRLPDYVEQEQS